MILKMHNPSIFTYCLLAAIAVFFVFARPIAAHDDLRDQIISVTREIKKDPKNAALYLKRAELYRLHREWASAERDFKRAEKLDPNLAAVDLGRGRLRLDAGNFAGAKTSLKRFLAREPNNYTAVIAFARVSARLRETTTAAEYFTQAIRLAPQDAAEIYLERARVLAAAGKIEEALRGLDEGAARFGGLITLQTAAIDIEVGRKNYDAALTRLDRLAAQMPRRESFLLRRAEILLKAGKPCPARADLLESKKGFESLSAFRKNVPAVKAQIIRIQKLLAQTSKKNCR
jgi:predicted Zn-dependent protease